MPDSALGAHLRHGDTLGPCEESPVAETKETVNVADIETAIDGMPSSKAKTAVEKVIEQSKVTAEDA